MHVGLLLHPQLEVGFVRELCLQQGVHGCTFTSRVPCQLLSTVPACTLRLQDPTSDACAQTRVHECEFNNPRCLPLLLGLAAGQDHINNLLQAAFTCTALQMTDESVQLDMAFAGDTHCSVLWCHSGQRNVLY